MMRMPTDVRLKAALAREGLFLNVSVGVADAVIAAAPAGRDDAAVRVRTLIEMAERELDRTRDADGRWADNCKEVADLDLNTLELLCSGISDMEERIAAGELIIEPQEAGNTIKIKNGTDNLLSRAQIHTAFVSLLSKYSHVNLSSRPTLELETFDICANEGLELDGSTIDKVTWNEGELRFYFDKNTDEYDYFSTFSFEGLKTFYLGLKKALESGEYDQEKD